MVACTLRLPPDAATVPLVRTICRDALERLGVASGCRADMVLALTEACANVIQHAGAVATYEVRLELGADSCHMVVYDSGRGLQEAAMGEMPQPEDDHGRGIALMHLLVDRLDVDSRPEEGTTVHLEKTLELEEDSLLGTLEDRPEGTLPAWR